MTRTTTATVAVAADYADAMLTARRAKNWLFILLALILLTQISVFFLVKLKVLKLDDQLGLTRPVGTMTLPAASTEPSTTEPSTTEPSAPVTATAVAVPVTQPVSAATVLRYVIPVLDFLGITLAIVLAIVLLLITLIMLVGRLIGVSHLTGAFIWCVLLVVFLFPWQSFLLSGPHDGGSAFAASITETEPSFKIPGVLYTWPELMRDHDFSNSELKVSILKWARFAGFPILALLMLLSIQAKSGRGLKFALGEADVQVELTSPTM